MKVVLGLLAILGATPTWADDEVGNKVHDQIMALMQCTSHEDDEGNKLSQRDVAASCADQVIIAAELTKNGYCFTVDGKAWDWTKCP